MSKKIKISFYWTHAAGRDLVFRRFKQGNRTAICLWTYFNSNFHGFFVRYWMVRITSFAFSISWRIVSVIIQYDSYYMADIIWDISYGAYHVDHMIWSIVISPKSGSPHFTVDFEKLLARVRPYFYKNRRNGTQLLI